SGTAIIADPQSDPTPPQQDVVEESVSSAAIKQANRSASARHSGDNRVVHDEIVGAGTTGVNEIQRNTEATVTVDQVVPDDRVRQAVGVDSVLAVVVNPVGFDQRVRDHVRIAVDVEADVVVVVDRVPADDDPVCVRDVDAVPEIGVPVVVDASDRISLNQYVVAAVVVDTGDAVIQIHDGVVDDLVKV